MHVWCLYRKGVPEDKRAVGKPERPVNLKQCGKNIKYGPKNPLSHVNPFLIIDVTQPTLKSAPQITRIYTSAVLGPMSMNRLEPFRKTWQTPRYRGSLMLNLLNKPCQWGHARAV